MNIPQILLKSKRSASILRKHPWVFSGAIEKIILPKDYPHSAVEDGELVEVCNQNEQTLGIGHFSNGSIAVRLISFEKENIDHDFWQKKLRQAFDLRKMLGLVNSEETTCYRLIHGEGDQLPGLIIDCYGPLVVLQAHSKGMANALIAIATALKKLKPNIRAIYSKSEQSLHSTDEKAIKDGFLIGELEAPQIVLENQLKFEIDWIKGQKTGFFIDQRENRLLLQQYVAHRKVLNTFCYSGGFSIYALAAKADLVHSVDSSASAIELTENNIKLNFGDHSRHQSFTSDTLKLLQKTTNTYDTIILDPPAYAKNKNSTHNAVQAYKRLNALAMKKINAKGILFTFSCSQLISRKLFTDTITAAAIEAGRKVKILHHLSQPADHPVNIFHPEGEYLKGLVLYIES